MNHRMRRLRLVVILVVTALLNLDGPLLPERADDFEEFREALHGRGRSVRLAPEVTPEPAAVARPATLSRPAAVSRRPRVRRTQTAPRKSPPARSDPASRSDDH
jgi:hypothetical protein